MRTSYHYFLLLIAVLMTTGCATTDTQVARRPLWKSPKAFAKEQAEAKQKKGDKEDVASTAKNPFKKATAAESSKSDTKTVAKSDGSAPEKPAKDSSGKDPAKVETASTSKTSDAANSADPKSAGVFGPETLLLIDAELVDATPEERAFWYDQLKKVDPAVIPQILEARRLTAQVAEQQRDGTNSEEPTSESSSFGSTNGSTIEQASGATSTGNVTASRALTTNSTGQKFPPEKNSYQQTSYDTANQTTTPQMEPAANESPLPTNGKGPFAVTKVAEADPQDLAPPAQADTSNHLMSRNPLSRFLPKGSSSSLQQASANQSSGVSLLPPADLDSRDPRAKLEELISQLEAEVARLEPGTTEAAQTEYIQYHVYLRLLYLMADHPERALTAIPGIDSSDQEFWQQTLWAMANYFDTQHLPSAKDRAGQAVAQLATATQRLKEKADLEIHNMAFCREISAFGSFVRFPRDEFRPGDSALLYAEIENFKSEMTIDGQYRTLIRSTVEILSPSGEVRWHKEFPATEDLCNSYRRDYYHNYKFLIPDRLPLGPHQLKLTAFDELSGKLVSQSINFVVR